jgi:hypothetical protein
MVQTKVAQRNETLCAEYNFFRTTSDSEVIKGTILLRHLVSRGLMD